MPSRLGSAAEPALHPQPFDTVQGPFPRKNIRQSDESPLTPAACQPPTASLKAKLPSVLDKALSPVGSANADT